MKPILVCGLLLLANWTSTVKADDRAQIHAVVESFRSAIVDKDAERFEGLFVPGAVTWQAVMSDAALRRVREKRPDAVKLRFDSAHGPRSFIDSIVAAKDQVEEVFGNVRIETDGDIASVVFDYRFMVEGRQTNHGLEAWHLLRSEQGWRIVSVIWSISLP